MLFHYAALVLRTLRRSPVTAFLNITTLALGLVSFVTAYAVTSYWDSSERHFANRDRTYVITTNLEMTDGSITTGTMPLTNELYERYLGTDFPEFAAVARAFPWNRNAPVASNDRSVRLSAVAVDPAFVEIFDLPFVAGDPSTALQDPKSVLLTEDAAIRLFGRIDVLGEPVKLGGNLVDATVTGILAPIPPPSHMGQSPGATLRFDILVHYDVFRRLGASLFAAAPAPAPAEPAPTSAAGSGPSSEAVPAPPPENWLSGYGMTTYVMLKPDSGLSRRKLNERLGYFGRQHVPAEQQALARLEIGAVPVSGLMVTSLNAQLLGGGRLSITTLLLGLGTLVLLVGCINYANLAAARAARRAREIGLRKVIGASRRQIIAQYLLEAGLSTTAALVVAIAVVLLIAPAVSNAVSIDLRDALFAGPRFWVFAGALLAAVTVLGGAYPAFVLSLVRPVEALRLGRARASSRFASTLLVGTQFAAASFLLIMVIVMYAQNADLRRTGLRATNDPHLVIASLSRVTGIETEILHAELARIPQVKGVTQMGQPPWANGVGLTALARTPDASAGVRTAVQNVVGYDFFSTLEIPLVAGRAFERGRNDELPRDSSGSDKLSPINFVVDRVLAAELGFAMPADAIDQIVYLPGAGDAARPMNIIGVVESRPLFLRGFGATANAYLLAAGGPGAGMQNHIVRLAAQDVAGGVAAIDAMWRRLGARTPLQRRFMDEMFDDSYEQFARVNQVFAVLAAFAFFISIVGLFGMAIQVAGRRVHEIGVRKSVGATKAQMVGMLLRDFARPVVIANLVAWPLAYVGAQAYLSVFIQRIGITPAPFLLSLGIVVLIACIAVGGQALRAARANPAEVLRFE